MGFRRLLQYDWFPYDAVTVSSLHMMKCHFKGRHALGIGNILLVQAKPKNLGSKLNKCKMGSTARIFHINLGAHSWLLPAHKFMMVVFWPAFLGYDGCAMMNLLSWT